MATRHQVRVAIIGLLYARDAGNENITNFADEIFEENKIRNNQKEFAVCLYNGILDNIADIDSSINNYLKEWELKDIGAIERSLLRLGAYELIYTKTDSAVVINEAIEIAKEFGNDTSSKFVNGVLDSIKKNLS